MPILDTVVLFGANPEDPRHISAKRHLQRIIRTDVYLGSFALLEFDVVLKNRGFSFGERMERHASIRLDYPDLDFKVNRLSPWILYLTCRLEEEMGLDYFDAGMAAEALLLDGRIVSTDRVFDEIEGLTRIW